MYNSNLNNEIVALYKKCGVPLQTKQDIRTELNNSTINNKLNSKLSIRNKSSTIVLSTNTIKKYWFAIQKDLFT